MEKNIGNGTLLAGAYAYISCGVLLHYFAYTAVIFEKRFGGCPTFPPYEGYEELSVAPIELFMYFGGYTVVFWIIFLRKTRGRSCMNLKTFGVAFLGTVVISTISFFIRIDDDFLPCIEGFPPSSYDISGRLLPEVLTNYLMFILLITAVHIYRERGRE